jgi:predicted site-specific integrase-resolvase
MNKIKYVNSKKAKEILGVHIQTLYNWEKKGKIDTIRTVGGHRMYNVQKYLASNMKVDEDELKIEDNEKKYKLCYIRVSTNNQKDDLERQRKYMKDKYPTHLIIEDIGSGINFNRKGIRKIIKYAISGEIKELVIAYKDRLTRFGYELIEDLIKEYSNGEIIVDNKINKDKNVKEEMVEDVLQILNVYTAKMNGLRKYEKKLKVKKAL